MAAEKAGRLTERNGGYEEEMGGYTIERRERLRDRDCRVNEWYLEERSLGEFGNVKVTSEQLSLGLKKLRVRR
jgi:hypothetical protein